MDFELFRAYKTLIEMLNDRGYGVSTESLNLTKQDFDEKFPLGTMSALPFFYFSFADDLLTQGTFVFNL